MAFFKSLFSSKPDPSGESLSRDSGQTRGPETAPIAMNLEERMSFRRELLFETIRASLAARAIAPGSYRFKVMRTDKRGHRYVVMLDMSPAFMESAQGQHRQRVETAAALTHNAQQQYGLIVMGVYWRSDDTLDETAPGATRAANPDASQAARTGQPLSNVQKYEHASAADLATFEATWQKNSAINIGGRSYSSDLAPLEDEPPEK